VTGDSSRRAELHGVSYCSVLEILVSKIPCVTQPTVKSHQLRNTCGVMNKERREKKHLWPIVSTFTT
jgi:hypothetical protein